MSSVHLLHVSRSWSLQLLSTWCWDLQLDEPVCECGACGLCISMGCVCVCVHAWYVSIVCVSGVHLVYGWCAYMICEPVV